MAMRSVYDNSLYPYVSVSLPTMNPGGYVPTNPMVGQLYSDNSGCSWVWTGSQWQPSNNNYNTLHNNYTLHNNVGTATIGGDISIVTKKGTLIYVGEMIDRMMARLGMIDPDYELMEKYPSVKAAYEEYEKEFAIALSKQFPDLKAAIDSYNMIISLVKADNTNASEY